MNWVDIELKLAPTMDRGRALARIPSEIMETLGIEPGDAVAVRAAGQTHCRAVRAPAGLAEVQLDEFIASRIGAVAGKTLSLALAKLPPLSSAIVSIEEDTREVRSSDLREALFDLPVTVGDQIDVPLPVGGMTRITVTETDPAPAGFLTAETILSVSGQFDRGTEFQEIGGLEDEIARVQEMVSTPLNRPDLFEGLGVQPPRGVLFVGPPGTGKTLLARAVAARTSAAFFQINGPEIVSKHYGESEAALRQVFDAASRQSPAIIFIDEIDAVAPRREGLSGEKQVERRVVAQLLTLLDGMAERGRVVVMAATNLPDSIDPALRRPGRLEREILFRAPNRAQRREILGVHLKRAPLAQDADLDAIAEASHGYVGADLAALAREAGLAALAREVMAAGGEDRVDSAQLHVTARDLRDGLAATRPALLRDDVVESPSINWSDIGGLDEVKAELSQAVIWPIKHRDAFRSLRVPPARGVLLTGPPGTGKTLLARGLAGESGLNFVSVQPTRILSQFLGEAERAVAELFAKARHAAPCILFFDEFDSLARRRSGQDAVLDRVVAQLLVEMDGLLTHEDVVVLAATNRPSAIDPALLRPGRIDRILHVPLPDPAARTAIVELHLSGRSTAENLHIPDIVAASSGLSGADLASLVQSAARSVLHCHLTTLPEDRGEPKLTRDDLFDALSKLKSQKSARDTDHLDETERRTG